MNTQERLQSLHKKAILTRRQEVIARHVAYAITQGSRQKEAPESLLDVGCGNGEISTRLKVLIPTITKAEGVEVQLRPQASIPVKEFDGVNLPYDSKSKDVLILCDVLHHVPTKEKQLALLEECKRVTKNLVVIKDHLCESPAEHKILSFMDWVGNRAHGVDSPNIYLSAEEWHSLLKEKLGGKSTYYKDKKFGLYPFPASLLFENSPFRKTGSLHFVQALSF